MSSLRLSYMVFSPSSSEQLFFCGPPLTLLCDHSVLLTDLLVEDLEKWFSGDLTRRVRITIVQSAAHILNTYDAKISGCTLSSIGVILFRKD